VGGGGGAGLGVCDSLVLLSGLSWGYFKAVVLMGLGQVKELCQMKGWFFFFFFLGLGVRNYGLGV
jgi:hypothetical protein